MTLTTRYLVLAPAQMFHWGTTTNHNQHTCRREMPFPITPACIQVIPMLALVHCHPCHPSVVRRTHTTNMHMMTVVFTMNILQTLSRKIHHLLPTYQASLLNLRKPANNCRSTPEAIGNLLGVGVADRVLYHHVLILLILHDLLSRHIHPNRGRLPILHPCLMFQ